MPKPDGAQSYEALPPSLCVVGASDTPIWGLTPAERHQRAFGRAGVSQLVEPTGSADQSGTVALVRAEFVLAEELVRALVSTPGVVPVGSRIGAWLLSPWIRFGFC